MMSLGLKGLGRTDEAEKCAQQLLAMDNAHQESGYMTCNHT